MVVMSHDANPSLKDTNYRFEQKYFEILKIAIERKLKKFL